MPVTAAVEDVIRRVEEASGKPVLVNPDPALKLMATVKMARGTAPAHLVSYNPSVGASAEYMVVYQCGFILRTFTAPPEDRLELVGTYRGRKETEKALAEHLRAARLPGLSREVRDGLTSRLYEGLMRQLRSYPVGLRVDAWIAQEYPQLAPLQRVGAEQQLRENLQNLSPQVRQIAPRQVYDANLSMCAAFAQFWASAWGEPAHAQPFTTTGHSAAGQHLLQDFAEIPGDPAHDRRLVDAWGERLGLRGWYELQPVSAN